MITARTQNSVYEIDVENSRVRRLKGVHEPTPNQGQDGEWKTFHAMHEVLGGYLFQWDEGGNKSTLTSPVISKYDSTATPVGEGTVS